MGHQRSHEHQHGHGHGHGHGHMDFGAEDMVEVLIAEGELHEGHTRQTAAWLRDLVDGPVARVVDVGSGPGVAACLLAEEFPGAEVVALDPEESLLALAAERAAGLGVGDRFRTQRAVLPDELGDPGPADLVWASRSLHHVGDQQAAVTAVAGLLRPGGVLAVVEGGLSARHLPRDIGIGAPDLETRLEALGSAAYGSMRAELPGAARTVEDWPGMLSAAGLAHTGTRTFLVDLPPPLAPGDRQRVLARWRLRHGQTSEAVGAEDRATLDVLLDPDSPHGIQHRPDVFFLHALTVHTGRR